MQKIDKTPEGFRGWLILVMMLLISTPIVYLPRFVLIFLIARERATGATSPGGAVYGPPWTPLMFFEFLSSFFSFTCGVVLIYFFFKKKRSFPPLMTIFLFCQCVLGCFRYLISEHMPQPFPSIGHGGMPSLLSFLIILVASAAYLRFSKRVRNTFVL